MRKKAFSLIEVLVVLLLVSTVSVLFSWNIYKRYQKDFFILQVHKLERWVELLQNIAAVHGADIICQFLPTQKGWEVKAGFSKEKGFSSKKKPQVQHFEKIEFRFSGEKKPFTLLITSSGMVLPKEKIQIKYKNLSKEWDSSNWNRFRECATKEPFFSE